MDILRQKNWLAALVLPLLGGCQLLNSELDCAEPEPYHYAREAAPLSVADNQVTPPQRADRRIPEIKPPANAEIGRCLKLPPNVLSNESKLALADSGVKTGREKSGSNQVLPWPELTSGRWINIDPLAGANLEVQLQPGLPAWRIHDLLQNWADAWSRQEVDPYFAFYAGTFLPENGQNWSQWRNDRLAQVVGVEGVDVSVYGTEAQVLGADRVAVRFTERYRAAENASVTRKEMILVREGDVWSIKRERGAGQP